MASTYTSRLRLNQQGTGDNSNTWGTVLNDGVISITDDAIAGYAQISFTAANVTLSTNNGAGDQARMAFLEPIGTLTANVQMVLPSVSKGYWVKNSTTGAFNVSVGTLGATGVNIPQGGTIYVLCNGSATAAAPDSFPGGVATTGAVSVGSTLTVTGATCLGSTSNHVGAATFAAAVSTNSTLQTTGAIGTAGAASVGTTLDVTGAVSLNSTLVVEGATSITGTLTLNGAVSIGGVVVNILGPVSIGNTLTVSNNGGVSVQGAANFSGATSIGSTLNVTGAVSTASTLTAQGAVSTAGALTVTGAVSGASTLTIFGAASIVGNTRHAGTMDITGATSLASTLAVNGTVSAAGTLNVNGTTSLNNSLTVNGALSVGGFAISFGGPVSTTNDIILGGGGGAVLRVLAGNTAGFSGVTSVTGVLQCVSVVQYTVSANVSTVTVSAVPASHKVRFLGPGGEVLWLLATSVAG